MLKVPKRILDFFYCRTQYFGDNELLSTDLELEKKCAVDFNWNNKWTIKKHGKMNPFAMPGTHFQYLPAWTFSVPELQTEHEEYQCASVYCFIQSLEMRLYIAKQMGVWKTKS
jgi:hypothetical protein